jgi:hypothetical protein
MAKLALRGGPFIPDGYPVFNQVSGVGLLRNQKFMDNGFQVNFSSSSAESHLQIKPHLQPNTLQCGTGAVLLSSMFKHMLHRQARFHTVMVRLR